MDEFFRSQQSPRGGESQMNSAFVSPPRNGPLLPRRFTTESGRVPTLSSITTTQRGPEPQPQDFTTTMTLAKVQMLEKKRMDYERLREHKRRFEAEIHKLSEQERLEERELAQMTEDLRYNGNSMAGHQSEPTTPPEYRETSSGFPTLFSRPNRYSMSSLTLASPPGLFNRPGRSGSQLASPQSTNIAQSRFAFDDQLPSRSVPGSRRNSDEDEKEEAVRQDPTSHRSTNALNRYSMPVTRSRTYLADMGLEDSNNTTGFLFGDEDSNSGETRTTPQANNSDAFPTLFRQGYSNMNMSSINSGQINGNGNVGTAHSPDNSTPVSRPSTIRHSFDMKYFQDNVTTTPDTPASVVSPAVNHILTTPPKLQQSFSTSDVPSAKSVSSNAGNANNHAQQHFHNHNASIGRIPAGAVRHSRELSNDATLPNGREVTAYPSITSTLQANAAPFGPASTQAQQTTASAAPAITSPGSAASYQYIGQPNFGPNGNPAGNPPPPAGYSMQLMMSMQNLNLNGAPNGTMYSPQNYTGYGALYNTNTGRPAQDSQARVIQSRRQMDSEAMARYNNLPLESVGGTIYTLCKDQHGCRYLQRQLENRQPEQIHMIWLETNQHVVELMTDPFGNYLCQKLFEYCSDEERTVLIENASAHMVKIALNQHGTRALQKMIEFVTLPVQVNLIIEALRFQVVELIQDLNGNHVIQKCLNKLSANDAYFIFEAVGNNCVEVGTHRHGCCVLQRCIDHAEGHVKTWLVEQITQHAFTLVQDPFGNYVVQYIIDLNESAFTEPVVQQFRGRISMLSKHKFSSNVIEKCLRCASDEAKDMITSELLGPGEMERLIRDSFANYVIQTALEYSTTFMKHQLVETIRPMLPGIRSTPYGRRIQAKIQAYDNRSPATSNGQVTPADTSQGQIPLRSFHANRGMTTGSSILTTSPHANGINGATPGGRNTYPASNMITVPPLPPLQAPLTAPLQASLQAPLQGSLQGPLQAPPQPPRVQQIPPQGYNGNRAVPTENGDPSWL